MKEVKLNREEKELIEVAGWNGFRQWGYRTWRMATISKGRFEEYVLTKSIANEGEWSFVKKVPNGETRVKMTTKDIDYVIGAVKRRNVII